MTNGYFSDPAIRGSQIAFVSEDDLWLYDLVTKSPASRITSSKGQISNPVFNADGTQIAYTSNEYGGSEVFLFDISSGEHHRLTYFGKLSVTRYWDTENDRIIFSSTYGKPTRGSYLYSIAPEGGAADRLPYGHSLTYSRAGAQVVIGRYRDDTARWKRYKGGTAGQIWYAADGTNFVKIDLGLGNYVNPMLIGEYIYFLSDFEGLSNLYRLRPEESTPEQLTFSDDYYFRKAQTDGTGIIMQKGGSLFVFDVATGDLEELDISYISSREVSKIKFVDHPEKYVETLDINPKDTHVMSIIRGKPFYFPFWEEGTLQLGKPHGVRYKNPVFHPDKNLVYMITDELGEDGISIFNLDDLSQEPEVISSNIGIVYSMIINKTGSHLALFNNRMQVILIDLETNKSTIIKEPDYGTISTIDFSPDGKWLTYVMANSNESTIVMVYSLEADESYEITTGDFNDFQPRFSPDGKYIYFLSNRAYNPLIDSHLFQYDFPQPTKIFAIVLAKDGTDPVRKEPQPLSEKPGKTDNNGSDGDEDAENKDSNGSKDSQASTLPEVKIDLEGILERVIEIPVPNDRIHRLEVAQDRLFFLTSPVKGMQPALFGEPKPERKVSAFILKTQKVEVVMAGISTFSLSDSKSTLIVKQANRFRLLPHTHLMKMEKNNGNSKNGSDRESKYLDLSRVKLKISPHSEWEQMLKETWKLMKDHYWEENMAGLNWELMLEKYLQLVKKISSRAELSDLMWELQAESRTSHSYEFGGDYEYPPNYAPAYLGAEFSYDAGQSGYAITSLLQGDIWDRTRGSPLRRAGLHEGDLILAVDGQPVDATTTVQELLMGKKNQEVYLSVKQEGELKQLSVKPVPDETSLRYRDWVEHNRRYVAEKSEGRIGYFHIPDMGYYGLQEFYRYFAKEAQKEALIVDVRFNGGGHTSQLFLEKLTRRRLGFNIPRYGKKSSYPAYSVEGPMVALTNQDAGSDGDIFSHSFKMLNLGKLIGTRTWGGVIGIWPKVRLVDGTIVTQPEYSFWFNDVGYDVENYGTDPDIEVDITPNDAMAGQDPQLDRGIKEILDELEAHPVVLPDLDDKPIKS